MALYINGKPTNNNPTIVEPTEIQTLWSGSSDVGAVTLNRNYTDYDLITFKAYNTAYQGWLSNSFSVSSLSLNTIIVACLGSTDAQNRRIIGKFTSVREFTVQTAENGTTLVEIIGYKFGTGYAVQPVIYSDEEREIGVWRDGKPLYEKVLDLGSDTQISYNSWTQTSINLTSIDRLIFISGLNSAGTAFYGDLMGGDNNGILQLQTSRNGTYVSVRYLIFRYTKSTDTTGSGTWTPQGVPSHHYSIDEKVVGTWIDGSTIYEKTIYVPTLSISSSGTVNQTIEANFVGNNLISVSGYKTSFENSSIYSIPDGRLRVFIDDQANLKLEAINSGTWAGSAYVTIRYTKSTD